MTENSIVGMRVCTKCGVEKPDDKFGRMGERNGRPRLRAWCKACTNADNKARRDENLEKYREIERISSKANFHKNGQAKRLASMKWRIIKKYGLTVEQYEKMHRSQGAACAICKKHILLVTSGSGNRQSACIDHDHETGQIRGLLCHACNTAIGALKDDMMIVEAALIYLRKHKNELYANRCRERGPNSDRVEGANRGSGRRKPRGEGNNQQVLDLS
jgi:hypothetical protein